MIKPRNHPSFIIVANWIDFCVWCRDGGYDESYLDINDGKCLALQEAYNEELMDQAQDNLL